MSTPPTTGKWDEAPAPPRRGGLPVAKALLAAIGLYHLGAMVALHLHKGIGAAVFIAGLLLFRRPLARLLGTYLVDNWRILDQEARLARSSDAPDHFDYRPLAVLATAAVVLTLIEYFGSRDTYHSFVRSHFPGLLKQPYYALSQFYYWAGFRIVGYIAIPWLVVCALPGERIRDYGMSTRGLWRHLWIYGVLFAIILPALIMVSFTEPFQRTYPFYRQAARSWGDFFAWELAYALQFFALEVFFRGFLLHPLKRALGAHAISVMAVPYCMIHYNKPLAEVFGAIVAGVVLGTLSLRTRSIWCGVLIHVSVAVTMDLLSIGHSAGYPGNPQFVG